MRREDKYPETDVFMFHNENPKNRKGGDCVIRAVATALEQSWEQTVREMTEIGIKYGYVVNDKQTIAKYLESKGWVKHKQPRKDDGTKYTGKDFCNYLSVNQKSGVFNIVANIGGHHTVCIKPTNHGDGINCRYKVLDIWNSTDGCIGNFWTKPQGWYVRKNWECGIIPFERSW